jgi:hypothetical protein
VGATPNRLDPTTSIEDNLALINQNFDALDDQDRTKIIRNGTTPALLLGYQKGGFGTADYGLKIAKTGVDVTTASNDQLIFNSNQDMLKIVSTGTVTIPAAVSASGSVSGAISSIAITHGLGYLPILSGFVMNSTEFTPIPGPINMMNTGINVSPPIFLQASIGYIHVYLTTTTATFTLDSSNINYGISGYTLGPFTVRYYFMQETAN